jgi:two-component system KDP operon response regulator KdpE
MSSPRLLLVEDDPQIVRALVPALEVCGYAVTIALEGGHALAQIDAQGWEAAVIDLGLPDMDGSEVVRHLRARGSTPVIVISARHSPEDRLACREAGAAQFLPKPFATPDLIDHLASVLG